jgi:hypothetical protein
MRTCDQPALGWTVVLRRQPVRIVAGQAEGGYTDVFELICSDCGDHPELDYRDIAPRLQRVRGPYPLAAGVAAYGQHLKLGHEQVTRPQARQPAAADRQDVLSR